MLSRLLLVAVAACILATGTLAHNQVSIPPSNRGAVLRSSPRTNLDGIHVLGVN